MLDILADLRSWKAKFLFSRIVWSMIIPQHGWRTDCNVSCINRARRKVNKEVCRAIVNGIGSVIGHPEI